MFSLLLLVISIILCWIYLLWSRRSYYNLMLKVPGPKGYPLIGSSIELFHKEDRFPRIKEYFNRFGKAFLMWLGPYPFYTLCDPQLIKEVLNSPHCINKCAYIYDLTSELFGNGIITSENPMWSKHRKLLNPAFKHNVLLSFMPIFNSDTKDLIKLMDTHAGAGAKNLSSDLLQFTLRLAQKTTMGTDMEEEKNYRKHSLAHSAEYLMDILSKILFSPWLQITLIRKLTGLYKPINEAKSNVNQILGKIIDVKLETQKNTNLTTEDQPKVFIDHALTHLKNGNFTYQNVIDQSINIVVGAFETSADVILFTLTLLAMHPEYQEKLFEELYDLYPHTGDFEVAYEDIQNLKYLNRILNESMRLIPPVPMVGRRTIADLKLSNGVLLPEGTNIAISIFDMHHSADVWGPEAQKFNPDNFLPDNIQSRHPYSFIPFTKGTRNCIGWRYALMSVKITLIKMLRNYKFSTEFRFNELIFINNVTMKLLEVPLLKLEKRNK